MSYMVRNTLVLGILLLIVGAAGSYYRWVYQAKQEKNMKIEMQTAEDKLQQTASLIDQYTVVSKEVTGIIDRWSKRSKDIPESDHSSGTYEYINQLIDWSGFLKLDMVYVGNSPHGKFGYNTYTLKGEGSFANFYRFLWFLENGRKLYKINSIGIRGVQVREKADEDVQNMVTFDMEVQAFYTSMKELTTAEITPVLSESVLATDPFVPLITTDIPPNIHDLVEVERSTLRAVIPGKAFVVDQKSRVVSLEVGDEVYLGYVTKIDADQGRVEFTLNKGGIAERAELKTVVKPVTAQPAGL